MNLIKRSALALTASAAALCLIASPAAADTVTFKDGTKPSGPDIKYAKVAHGATRVSITADVGKVSGGSTYTVWYDTNSRDSGPEYQAHVTWQSDSYGFLAVETFKSRGTLLPNSCNDGFRVEQKSRSVIYLSVLRRCMGNPSKVRITLKADAQNNDYSRSVDYLPAKERFTGWVSP